MNPERSKSDNESKLTTNQRSIELIAERSTSLMEGIAFTWDCPDNANSRMPVLDTAIGIGQEARIKGIPTEIVNNVPHKTWHPEKDNIVHLL